MERSRRRCVRQTAGVIRVVCVGRARGPLAEASAEYEERLKRACKFELCELKEEGTPSLEPREAMLREGARIEPLLAGYWVVALDRSGVQKTSRQVAEIVREREERPPQRTAFVLGGPHGIDETLLADAELTWSLGKGTLPHQLARVVVLEQLYRAFTILRGEPYHR
jgi:23S rRNA (pseudouridine1915-N3)-methyltransferase